MRYLPDRVKNAFHTMLYVVLILCIFLIILLSSVPPVSRDALTHHLAIPKRYLLHGGIYEIPDLLFSYYPMNLDYLYMIPLAFGNDIIPKFIHFTFALLTTWLIYGYLKKRIDRCYGMLGALFFLSLPIIIKLSITVYVDLGLIFFSTASLLLLFQWIEKQYALRSLITAGMCCGLAVGTKYNGLISLLLLTSIVPVLYIRSRNETAQALLPAVKYGLIFFSAAFLTFSPWLFRNYLWTGNPLFPLFNHVFNPQISGTTVSSEVQQSLGIFTTRALLYHETPLQILLLPLRIFFEGHDNNPQYFDGRLNPFLLLLPLFAFFRSKTTRQVTSQYIGLAAFSILFLLFALLTTAVRIRYIGPIIPPLTILAILGLRNLVNFSKLQGNKLLGTNILGLILVSAMLLPNCIYLYHQFEEVEPFQFLTGQVNREAYLRKHRSDYAAKAYANKHLPHNAKILCLFIGGRGYYLDRPHMFMETFPSTIFNKNPSPKPVSDFITFLQNNKITYLLLKENLLAKTLYSSLSATERKKLLFFFRTSTQCLFTANGYSIYRISYPVK